MQLVVESVIEDSIPVGCDVASVCSQFLTFQRNVLAYCQSEMNASQAFGPLKMKTLHFCETSGTNYPMM